jgi:hypothetical protein
MTIPGSLNTENGRDREYEKKGRERGREEKGTKVKGGEHAIRCCMCFYEL